MDRTKTLIISSIVLILVVGLVVGVVIFAFRLVGGRQKGEKKNEIFPPTTNISPTPAVAGDTIGLPTAPQTPSENFKAYSGAGFKLMYQANWGLLTCNNSKNFELEPTSQTDQLNVHCDIAARPVTVLVKSNLSCRGEEITLGGNRVVKSVESDKGGEFNYRWCVITNGIDLDITHRVSSGGGRATSTGNYSQQVEQMISTLTFGS